MWDERCELLQPCTIIGLLEDPIKPGLLYKQICQQLIWLQSPALPPHLPLRRRYAQTVEETLPSRWFKSYGCLAGSSGGVALVSLAAIVLVHSLLPCLPASPCRWNFHLDGGLATKFSFRI